MTTQSQAGVGFSGLVELSARALGGRALECSDDFFASMHNLVSPTPAVFDPDRYTERGKWMDGWESRRRRGGPDADYCILALGAPGCPFAVDIDTRHFLGNHPPYAALDGLHAGSDQEATQEAAWCELVPQSPLQPGSQNLFLVRDGVPCTHVRLRIFPDGGVARLRVWGEVQPNWQWRDEHPETRAALRPGEVDLVSLAHGGKALACSDMFFSPMHNLILPTPAGNMGEGWETRRKRQPGHDWIVLQLATRGRPRLAAFDTSFFKGNFPDRAWLEAIDAGSARITDLLAVDAPWQGLCDPVFLSADSRTHVDDLHDVGPVTHVRVNIAPDGGLSRFRLHGTPQES